ncbi:MAG: response regulator transcription factor [Pirellulales bacterium]
MNPDQTQTVSDLTSVLIVDDHDLVRRGLAALIEADPQLEICGNAADVDTAMELVRQTSPKLIIVDISLKASNGLDLIKRVHAHDEDIKMLVSSMHDEMIHAERALKAGANGYIHKEVAAEKVLEAIHSVLEGNVYLSERMEKHVLQNLSKNNGEVESDMSRLSDRELEVFEMIGRGMKTREIADSLHLSVKTVDTYRDTIKKKLTLDSGAELVCRAVRWVVEEGG